jgi:hypothetical protein
MERLRNRVVMAPEAIDHHESVVRTVRLILSDAARPWKHCRQPDTLRPK